MEQDIEKIKIMEEHIKNNEKKKIIIVGPKENVSPRILENIKEHFDCEIEILSPEEYKDIYPDFLADVTKEELEKINYELNRLEIIPFTENEKIKPEFPKKIGKVNNKKLSAPQKQYYKQKKGR